MAAVSQGRRRCISTIVSTSDGRLCNGAACNLAATVNGNTDRIWIDARVVICNLPANRWLIIDDQCTGRRICDCNSWGRLLLYVELQAASECGICVIFVVTFPASSVALIVTGK